MSAFAPPSCRNNSSDMLMIYGASIPVDAPVFMARYAISEYELLNIYPIVLLRANFGGCLC